MALVGSNAPGFTLEDENGGTWRLSDALKGGSLLLVFYPGDFTPVCTKQLCAYQGAIDAFAQLGVRLVGISPNPPESHRKFKAEYGFSFPLLTDIDKHVTRLYGVTSLFLLGGTSRAVVLVSRDGKIAYRYVEPTRITHRNPAELMAAIAGLKAKKMI